MKAVLIDDERMALDVLELQLSEIEGVEIVGKYTSANTAMAEIKELGADVLFLDMEMPEGHGLEFAEKLMNENNQLEIVFVTAHRQFALEAFELDARDYLLKPVIQKRLEKTIERLKGKMAGNERNESHTESTPYVMAQTLGSFHLFDMQGKQIKWRTKKVKELFIYLWTGKALGRSKDRLMEDLWPELPVSKASTMMHTTVYQLRKTLKDIGIKEPIVNMNDKYTLNVQVKSDISEIEQAMNHADQHFQDMERYIMLYKGDLLEEESYGWILHKQEAFKRSYLKFLEHFAAVVKKDHAHLLEVCLEKMIALDPYNEVYLYQLLDYYGRTNNILQMNSVFLEAKENWQQELGLELTKELTDLYYYYLKGKL